MLRTFLSSVSSWATACPSNSSRKSRNCELLLLNLSGAHVEPGAGMYAGPFVAAQAGGVDMNGMWVGTIGGGDSDKDNRDDIEKGVVTREVNLLIYCLCDVLPPLGTETDASLCSETVGGMSTEHCLVQAVFGLGLVCWTALNVSAAAELCSNSGGLQM
ncbi:hypothetical protein C8J55DRAFT_566879 [Lentinula edodes]|uniref:Uncharacterized protein n=1 Tax=Lentinula lateritia TaxID=40482 RepID=A0A9W8ZR08_9AGAR|nr:hypothetical protein C8J55DRAFT_566879 [Lentinula edodes]